MDPWIPGYLLFKKRWGLLSRIRNPALMLTTRYWGVSAVFVFLPEPFIEKKWGDMSFL